MNPKKSLGQNFLQDLSIVKKIIQSADLHPDDAVLEVGPGEGIMTRELVKYARRVIAVEIDEKLVELLRRRFKNAPGVKIVLGDILKINLPDLIKPHPSYKVIANLPYYITSAIIRLFLESPTPPDEMILMVQKEVAKRIVAAPGEMSLLAVSIQYYAKPEIIFEVSRGAFSPIPEVDSAVIKISNIAALRHSASGTKKFFQVARAGFSAKRKTLLNNLANSFHLEKKEVEKKLISMGINPKARAQELKIGDWKKLSKLF